jgi:CBS domain-containing protein
LVGNRAGAISSLGPFFLPYSPKCLEIGFSEVRQYGVLRSSGRVHSGVLATSRSGYETREAIGEAKGVIRMPQVRDRMVSSVVTIEPGTGVVDAAKRMIQEEKGPLPIVEGERPKAIVTDRDIIAHVVAEGRDPTKMTVDEIASQDLVTIGPEQDIGEARRLMDEHELDRILVVEDDRLVGIISEADIRTDEGPVRGVTDTAVGGVTEPVSGVTDTVGGVTDTVRGTTDRLLGGGEEKQR